MPTINILEAKSSLSRLVSAVENGIESEIVIARNGKPAAKLVPVALPAGTHRIGIAKGRFSVPDTIDAQNEAVAELFEGRGQ